MTEEASRRRASEYWHLEQLLHAEIISETFAKVEDALAVINAHLGTLEQSFMEATDEKTRVEGQARACQERLGLAERQARQFSPVVVSSVVVRTVSSVAWLCLHCREFVLCCAAKCVTAEEAIVSAVNIVDVRES